MMMIKLIYEIKCISTRLAWQLCPLPPLPPQRITGCPRGKSVFPHKL